MAVKSPKSLVISVISPSILVIRPVLDVTRPSRLPRAPPTLSKLVVTPVLVPSSSTYEGAVTVPLTGSTCAPPPRAARVESRFALVAASSVLVLNNWLPVTASVLVADSSPSFKPVSVRTPSVPVKSTTVPSVSLPTVMLRVVASCLTIPVSPLMMEVISPSILVMLVSLAATRPARLPSAPPTLSNAGKVASTA